MTKVHVARKHGVVYDPKKEDVVLADKGRPCGLHPTPTRLDAVCCKQCGAYKLGPDEPLVYIEKKKKG